MQTRRSPSLTTLHSLARSAAIPDYENLPKSILFQKLQESFDIERLQRVEARSKRIQELSNKKRQLEQEDGQTPQIQFKRRPPSSSSSSSTPCILNKLDPIMLNPIAKKNTWRFTRPNGSAVMFNLDTLVDYILTTGDFTDPETRIPFSEKDLKEVDDLVIKGKLKKSSVLEAKRNPQMFSDFKFRRDALQGLERCAGEVITDILTIIETCDPDEAQMRLIMRELPTFADYYRQLRDADAFFAKQCMRHWTQFLEGPPNRPNEDTYGLIEVVIHFLNMCDSVIQSFNNNNNNHSSSSSSSSSSSGSTNTAATTIPSATAVATGVAATTAAVMTTSGATAATVTAAVTTTAAVAVATTAAAVNANGMMTATTTTSSDMPPASSSSSSSSSSTTNASTTTTNTANANTTATNAGPVTRRQHLHNQSLTI